MPLAMWPLLRAARPPDTTESALSYPPYVGLLVLLCASNAWKLLRPPPAPTLRREEGEGGEGKKGSVDLVPPLSRSGIVGAGGGGLYLRGVYEHASVVGECWSGLFGDDMSEIGVQTNQVHCLKEDIHSVLASRELA
jgi:hypothetical protein